MECLSFRFTAIRHPLSCHPSFVGKTKSCILIGTNIYFKINGVSVIQVRCYSPPSVLSSRRRRDDKESCILIGTNIYFKINGVSVIQVRCYSPPSVLSSRRRRDLITSKNFKLTILPFSFAPWHNLPLLQLKPYKSAKDSVLKLKSYRHHP